MKIFEVKNEEDFVPMLIDLIEQQVGQTIFTLRVLDRNEESIDVVVAFEDKSMMMGFISIETIKGKLAARFRANFI